MKFVVGKEGSLLVRDRAHVQPAAVGHQLGSRRTHKIEASIRVTGCSWGFHIKRGVAVEWNDNGNAWGAGDGKTVYARVLPEDAERELAFHDLAIANAEEELKRLRAERQEFLAAHVVRGERISLRHIEALPPPEPPKDTRTPEEKAQQAEEARRANAFLGQLQGQMAKHLKGGA